MNDLSIRESQVIRLVAAGMTTKAIAAELSIAESTVNWHVGNVLAKLGASSRAEAVAIVLRDGAPAPPPVVIVRPPPPQGSRWWLAAAVAVGFLLALAGGTSVAAWYFGAQRGPTSPGGAPAPSPAGTETASAAPSVGVASGSPAPKSGADPVPDPASIGPLPTTPLPLSTPRLTPPAGVPTVTLLPLPTAPPPPTAPPLPTAPIPPTVGRGTLP